MGAAEVRCETHNKRRTNLLRPELTRYKRVEFNGLAWLYTMYISERFENLFHVAFKLGLGKSS